MVTRQDTPTKEALLEPIGLSFPDAGKALGGEERPLSRATIYREIRRGTLEAVKIGNRTLITMESIKARMASAPRLPAAQ